MRFSKGDVVKSKVELIEEACGDHPRFKLCEKGQKLKIHDAYPKELYPVQSNDSYLVADVEGYYCMFYMDCHELDVGSL